MERTSLLKSLLLLCALVVGCADVWAEKITDYNNIVSGKSYYIGATTSSTDYYLSVDGSSVNDGVAGTAVVDKSNATVFVFEGSGTSWSIKFLSSDNYLSLASSKANGKVNIVASSTNWTASNESSKIQLSKGDFALQKNNSGTQFGSYGKTQTDIWLIEADIPSHTASFSINGVIDDANNVDVEEGAAITFPSDPSDVNGKSFVGWTTATINGYQATVPTTLVTKDVMGTSDITYYAVFASKTVSTGDVVKSYGFETATDEDWTIDGPVRDEAKHNTGSYAGKINTNNTYVTFNSKVKVKEFSFAFTRTSANNNYNVYIETSSDNTSWTTAETYAMSTFNSDGTFTTKTKTFDGNTELYVRFHCNNTTAVRYVDDVTITYSGENITYTDYCTTVIPGPSDPVDNGDETITLTTTANMDGWRTFYDALQGYTADANTTVYVATANASDKVTLTDIGSKDIPAGTPVVLKTTDAGHVLSLKKATVDAYIGANELKVTTAGTPVTDVYRLGYKAANGIGFYKYSAASPAAGIVYVENVTPASEYLPIDVEDADITTGLSAIDNGQWSGGQWSGVNGQSMQVYILNSPLSSVPAPITSRML